MVDIHSHILWGLDDGAESLEQSVAMLRMAAESGTTDIVATPHSNGQFKFDPDLVTERIAELHQAAGPLPRIHRGCDFHLSLENIQDALVNPPKYAINGLNYLLVEFSDMLIPRTTPEIFGRLQSVGLTPIITHPERNALLHTRLDQMQLWIENGALVQVTAGSLLGAFGRAAKSVAAELMNRNMVHFVASDAHDTRYRTTVLRDAFEHVEKNWSRSLAKLLFVTAPKAAIEGEEIMLLDPVPAPPRKKWFRFGF